MTGVPHTIDYRPDPWHATIVPFFESPEIRVEFVRARSGRAVYRLSRASMSTWVEVRRRPPGRSTVQWYGLATRYHGDIVYHLDHRDPG